MVTIYVVLITERDCSKVWMSARRSRLGSTGWSTLILHRKLKFCLCCLRNSLLLLEWHLSNNIWNTPISGAKIQLDIHEDRRHRRRRVFYEISHRCDDRASGSERSVSRRAQNCNRILHGKIDASHVLEQWADADGRTDGWMRRRSRRLIEFQSYVILHSI